MTQGGNDVLALKDNHPTLHQDVQETFDLVESDTYQGVAHTQDQRVSKDHGRLETRRAVLITEPEYLAYLDPHQQWRGLRAIGFVESERQTAKGTRIERRYYLTTHTDAGRFAAAVREHWGIEKQYVDSHGQSEVAFAFCHLLGFQLLPHLPPPASLPPPPASPPLASRLTAAAAPPPDIPPASPRRCGQSRAGSLPTPASMRRRGAGRPAARRAVPGSSYAALCLRHPR